MAAKKIKKRYLFVLCLGIAAVGALCGFMTAASNTPVVGAALPLVFGVLMFGFGLLQANKPSPTGDEEAMPAQMIGFAGIAMLLFSASFALGIYGGATARMTHWPAKKPADLALPWDSKSPPLNPQVAFDWLQVQQYLLRQGYSTGEIAQLYALSLTSPVNKNKAGYPPALPVAPSVDTAIVPTPSESSSMSWQSYFTQPGTTTTPEPIMKHEGPFLYDPSGKPVSPTILDDYYKFDKEGIYKMEK